MKIKLNLSSKFIISITLLIIIVICLVIFTTLEKEKKIILGQMQKKGFVLTEILAMASIDSLLNYDYSTLSRYVDTVTKDDDVVSVMIVDSDGTVKMHSDIDLIGTVADVNFSTNSPAGSKSVSRLIKINKSKYIYLFSTPIIVKNQELGNIQIAMSTENAISEIEVSKSRLLMIGLIALIIGILGAVIMARAISKPLSRLAEGAKEVSKGNLNWTVDIKTKDEIGVLADAFEYMTYNLRTYIESLVKTERLTIIGELAAGIVHEVRNPLEPIKGSVEILQIKYKSDETVEKYARIIKDEINSICNFLDEFLKFARPPDSKFSLTDINSVIDETLSLAEHYIHKNHIRVEKYIGDSLPLIKADPIQLKQVFMNIILNSAQAKKGKDGLIKITFSLKRNRSLPQESGSADKKCLVVEFYDQGQGIENDKISKIYDPFFTTKEEGTGLGLAICHNIIENHNGKIEAESEYGQWTLIRISFPLNNVTAQVDRQKSE